MSSAIFCQNTGTPSINLAPAQVSEIYKGLKQNEYLKSRLKKTEFALSSAQTLIVEQDKAGAKSREMLANKEEEIKSLNEVRMQENKAATERDFQLQKDIEMIRSDLEMAIIQAKREKRKSFWRGVKTGAVGTAIIGTAAYFLIQTYK